MQGYNYFIALPLLPSRDRCLCSLPLNMADWPMPTAKGHSVTSQARSQKIMQFLCSCLRILTFGIQLTCQEKAQADCTADSLHLSSIYMTILKVDRVPLYSNLQQVMSCGAGLACSSQNCRSMSKINDLF